MIYRKISELKAAKTADNDKAELSFSQPRLFQFNEKIHLKKNFYSYKLNKLFYLLVGFNLIHR